METCGVGDFLFNRKEIMYKDDEQKRESAIYQLINLDNWEAVDTVDSFLYIFDRLPARMKLIVDLKMTGSTNKEIASLLKVKVREVQRQLKAAKDRIANGLY